MEQQHPQHEDQDLPTRIFICMDSEEYYRLKGNGLVPKIMVQDYTAGMTQESVTSGISAGDEESGFIRTLSTTSSFANDHAPPIVKPVNWNTSTTNDLSNLTRIAAETFAIPTEQPFLLRLIAFGNGIVPLMPIMIDNDLAVTALRSQDYIQICPIERVITGDIEEDPVNPQSTDDLISKLIMRVLRLPNPLRRRKRDDIPINVTKWSEVPAANATASSSTAAAENNARPLTCSCNQIPPACSNGSVSNVVLNSSMQSMQNNNSAM